MPSRLVSVQEHKLVLRGHVFAYRGPHYLRLYEAMSEKCVGVMIQDVAGQYRQPYDSSLRSFLLWYWEQQDLHPDLKRVELPSQMIQFQKQANRGDDEETQFMLLRVVQRFCREKGGTYASILGNMSKLTSLWNKNYARLPEDPNWHPRPTNAPVKGRLTFQQVTQIIQHAKPRDQAVFLVMFQGMLDGERFEIFNTNPEIQEQLLAHLDQKKYDEPFKIEFPFGRKNNHRPFHTYIYKDAQEALANYFEKFRGSRPKPGEPLILARFNKPMRKQGIRTAFITIATQLKYRQLRTGAKNKRTGVAPHEAFRDVVRTMLHTRGKQDGFDLDVAEFCMGHTVDPMNYDKFSEDAEYIRKQIAIASKYLNILSNESMEQKDLWTTLIESAKKDPAGSIKFIKTLQGIKFTN
ncbi:MAG: hypothetical protein ABSD49_10035 [Candidatus Bathyarchaeia archaeon]